MANGLRTVVLSRYFKGSSFSFNATNPTLNYITAVGSGPKLAIHKNKMPGSMSFLPIAAVGGGGGGACICAGEPIPFGAQKGGKFTYNPTDQTGDVVSTQASLTTA